MDTIVSLQTGYLRGVHPLVLKKRMIMELFGVAWTATKVLLMSIMLYQVFIAARTYHEHLPIPFQVTAEQKAAHVMTHAELEQHQLSIALKSLQCPSEKLRPFSEGILKGAHTIKVDPLLITAILYTECQFKMTARSPKGYKGLMQTPWASMVYADVDILLGCRIFEDKMRTKVAQNSNGTVNLRTALALYKGGLNTMAFRNADEVLALYSKLKARCANQSAN